MDNKVILQSHICFCLDLVYQERRRNISAAFVSMSFLPHICATFVSRSFLPHICATFIKFEFFFYLKIRKPSKLQERENSISALFVSRNFQPHGGFDDMYYSIQERSRLPVIFVVNVLLQNMEWNHTKSNILWTNKTWLWTLKFIFLFVNQNIIEPQHVISNNVAFWQV